MSDPDPDTFVKENADMLGRVLAFGNEEARAYVLALLANCEDLKSVEEVEDQLDRIKRDLR